METPIKVIEPNGNEINISKSELFFLKELILMRQLYDTGRPTLANQIKDGLCKKLEDLMRSL